MHPIALYYKAVGCVCHGKEEKLTDTVIKKKTKQTSGTISFYKTENGTIRARQTVRGHRFSVTAESKAKATALIGKVVTDYFKTGYIPAKGGTVRFDIYAQSWFDGKRSSVKASTFGRHQRTYISTIKDTPLSRLRLDEITAQDIQPIIQKMAEDYSQSSIRKTVSLLNMIFKDALLCGLIVRNPMDAVKMPSRENISKKTKEIQVLSDSEYADLLKAVDELRNLHGKPVTRFAYAPVFVLLANTGLRVGELLALTWSDIDSRKRLINIRRSVSIVQTIDEETGKVTQKEVITTPKTQNGYRKVYLNSKAEQSLRLLLSRKTTPPADDDFVVTKIDGGMCSHSALTRAYERQTRYYGHRSTNIHALRHTFATRSLAAGMDIKILSSMLGHSNVRITYDLYVHPDISEDQKTIELMDRIFSDNS